MSIAHKELVTMAAELILSGETKRVWICNQWWQNLPALVERAMSSEPNVSTRQPEYTSRLVFIEPFTTQRKRRDVDGDDWIGPRWDDPGDTQLIPQSKPPWKIAVCAYMPDDETHIGIRYNPSLWTILSI